MPRNPNSTDKPVALVLSAEMHNKFRVSAAQQGISMSALARKLAEEHVAQLAAKQTPRKANSTVLP